MNSDRGNGWGWMYWAAIIYNYSVMVFSYYLSILMDVPQAGDEATIVLVELPIAAAVFSVLFWPLINRFKLAYRDKASRSAVSRCWAFLTGSVHVIFLHTGFAMIVAGGAGSTDPAGAGQALAVVIFLYVPLQFINLAIGGAIGWNFGKRLSQPPAPLQVKIILFMAAAISFLGWTGLFIYASIVDRAS